jgi:DNA-binding transcriptional LysR family regulator
MELRQVEHFIAVAEERSFTRAAGRVHMVQSSLSSSLKALERELGTELFTRGRRGAELTDAGRALLPQARALLEEAERARDAVAEVRGVVRGTVRVATVALPKSLNVMSVLMDFRAAHPGVHVHLIHDGARDLVGLVARGEVDFAVSPLTRQPPSPLRFEPLVDSPLAVLCPRGHPFAARKDVSLDDLLQEDIIDLARGWWDRDLFDRAVADDDQHREIHIEIDEWFGLLSMIQRGVGVSYGPVACLDTELFDNLKAVPLRDAPVWSIGIVSRDDQLRGAAGRAFLQMYREHCRAALAAPKSRRRAV